MRNEWTVLQKIEMDGNCAFWKLIILSVFQISFVWFVMFDIMLGRHICLTQCKAVILSFTSNFSSFRANTSLRSRRLKVIGARKNGAREGDARERHARREGAPAREAHENRFHSLSESAEGSYCSYLREQYLAFYNTQHAFFKKYPFLTLFSSFLSCFWLKTI